MTSRYREKAYTNSVVVSSLDRVGRLAQLDGAEYGEQFSRGLGVAS